MLESIAPSVDKVLEKYPALVERYAREGSLLSPNGGTSQGMARVGETLDQLVPKSTR